MDVHQVKFTGFRCPKPIFKYEHANFPGIVLSFHFMIIVFTLFENDY
jgi:hypothetical protein